MINSLVCRLFIIFEQNYQIIMMTNKRTLKKSINFICRELFAECLAISLYNGEKAKENAEAILSSILFIHNDYVNRISHPEPGMKQKAYFKNLIESFNKHTDEIIDQIANIS